ncbi:YggS family pyridoxal phosphate enzyme [Candidatus Altiarchaeales archaeon WOR_SM1_SCG]|nr:YggS family pyridoxal phosphate enzyme [Candidatus Altiarchaeales archaeon WOR_SM1_SCG]
MNIYENYKKIRSEIPENIEIIAASKTRSTGEIFDLINAGCKNIGENYVHEAAKKHSELGSDAKKLKWHLIGHLQGNKVSRAIEIFDVIQTVDSLKLAKEIDKRAEKQITIYVQVNIGEEKTKSGVKPDELKNLITSITKLKNLKVAGLMTIEPYSINQEDARKYFRKMKILFDEINNLKIPGVDLKILSMGMSNSYKIAIDAGSNMVRFGTMIFGER